jgi:hypothetical protein
MRLAMPLLRSWSARSAEDREVLVRFQGVARHARGVRGRDASPLHCLRSSTQSTWLLRSLDLLAQDAVGSSPTGGTMRTRPLGAALRCQRRSGGFESRRPLQRPRSTKVVQLPRKRLASVRFRPRARYTTPTPSSNGSGSEITNLRMVVRVHSESRSWAVIWDQIGFQVRSAGFDSSTARERGKQLTWW